MDRPTLPFEGECCESGCDPCVWDTYYAALRAWEAQQESLRAGHDSDESSASR